MDHLQTQGISLPRLGLGTFRLQGDACRAAPRPQMCCRPIHTKKCVDVLGVILGELAVCCKIPQHSTQSRKRGNIRQRTQHHDA